MFLHMSHHAWNVDGSGSDRPPDPYISWIQYWEHMTGLPRSGCSFKGCKRRAVHGGHIWIAYLGPVITPVCAECNSCENRTRVQDSWAFLRSGLKVIRVNCTEDMRRAPRRFATMSSCSKCTCLCCR
jgi:hypothetical protein